LREKGARLRVEAVAVHADVAWRIAESDDPRLHGGLADSCGWSCGAAAIEDGHYRGSPQLSLYGDEPRAFERAKRAVLGVTIEAKTLAGEIPKHHTAGLNSDARIKICEEIDLEL
jgi:hypothetical protein